MSGDIYSYPQLRDNLAEKLVNRGFLDDLGQLVTLSPSGYDPREATEAIMRRLGMRLRNAPT